MVTRRRPIQLDHSKRVRERLAKGGRVDTRFWDRECVLMFYKVVIVLDGYAEMMGKAAPKNHKERRAVVEQHLPHLVDIYDGLYTLSLTARYYKGYATTENEWLVAVRCHEMLTKGMPVR